MFGKEGSLDVDRVGVSPAAIGGRGIEQRLVSGLFVRVDGRLGHAFDGGEPLARGAEFSAGVRSLLNRRLTESEFR